MKRIAAALVLAAGTIGVGATTASAATLPTAGSVTGGDEGLPVVGGLTGGSDRTVLPGVPVPFPDQLVGPAQNLSSTLSPVTAPL
ncbi:hypothetical protein [Streptomyces sp. 5-10]|uniref:hypothetical protein n=1 Tax=Streptomyces sp. 5-10 TaxID=878925 RepID=UPI00168ABCCA|nr:hypothetical protein [Streptomyces sp. 5-10]MBD3004727.1 hypothetical protein [Streptomyces sp. 5-10]